MPETTVSATAVRRLAVAAQGYTARYRRATATSVEAAIRSQARAAAAVRLLRAPVPARRPDRGPRRPQSERKEGNLVVRAFHREDGVRASGALDDALDRALDRLARTIGLEEVKR